MKKANLLILILITLIQSISWSQNQADLPEVNNYTLTKTSPTSAGVYDSNNILLRTLWSNVIQQAGSYTIPEWDGLDDKGVDVSDRAHHFLVVTNDIKAEWDGVIGNLSDSFTEKKHTQYNFHHDMVINDGIAYFISGWTEGHSPVKISPLNAMGTSEEATPSTYNTVIAQMSNRIATDGVRLYTAGRLGFEANISFVQAATFDNLSDYSKYEDFAGETVESVNGIYKAADILDAFENGIEPLNRDDFEHQFQFDNARSDFEQTMPRVTGLAVQKSGNLLFIAREKLSSLHILNKITGQLLQNYEYINAKHTKVDLSDDLWMVYDNANGNEILEKFTVNANDGSISSTGFKIEGFTNVQSIDFSPDGTTIAIADAGVNAHQVKGYDINSGAVLWTLGRNESYSVSARVYDDKFMFGFNTDEDPYENPFYARGHKDEYNFLGYESDGSLWVNDLGNFRYIKFNPVTGEYLDQMMWQRAKYAVNVDAHNPERVFYDYLEFEVDYSKPLEPKNENGAWRLKNNWLGGLPVGKEDLFDALKDATTLSNGRTYALIKAPLEQTTRFRPWSIIELVDGGIVRDTKVIVGDGLFFNNPFLALKPDGTFRWINDENTQTFYEQKIIGFDANHNPILGPQEIWDQFETSEQDFKQGGHRRVSGEFTSNGNMILFDGDQAHRTESDFHLGAWNKELGTYAFKTALGVKYDKHDPYPTDGTYDLRDDVHFRGSVALAMDDWIVWGYHGEGWESRQTNKWHMVTEEGLFLRDFGVAIPGPSLQEPYLPGMAGNSFTPKLVKPEGSDDVYLWHNDEGRHAGAHRWTISNLSSIQKFKMPLESDECQVDCPQEPFTIPFNIPGLIEAEDYDRGGQGIAYNDDNTNNLGGEYRTEGVDIQNTNDGGYNVGFIQTDEWLEYTVNVTESGQYDIIAKVASNVGGGSYQLEMDGEIIVTTTEVGNTGGWQSFIDIAQNNVSLETGEHILRFYVVTGGFNIDWMSFSPSVITGLDITLSGNNIKLYPNPAEDLINITGANGASYELFDNSGIVLKKGIIESENQIMNLQDVSQGIYFIKVILGENTFVEKIVKK